MPTIQAACRHASKKRAPKGSQGESAVTDHKDHGRNQSSSVLDNSPKVNDPRTKEKARCHDSDTGNPIVQR